MARKRRPTRKVLCDGVLKGDRILLSQAITIIESQHPQDQQLAADLLDDILPYTGGSIRIGVTGVPGVGKSTFIEAFGGYLTGLGKKLAVLSIDPTSSISHGSILGDKSRMSLLAQSPNAYIRPSPTGLSLGGVAHATHETILLCEAAGFDTVIVETVGVGQSETMVRDMVDFFLLLMLAGGGDELQGIKRGIMEMADAVVVNKADGDNVDTSQRAAKSYENALHLFPPKPSGWIVPATTCSSLESTGITEIWNTMEKYLKLTQENGYFQSNRSAQRSMWFTESLRQQLIRHFAKNPKIDRLIAALNEEVNAGKKSVRQAVAAVLDHINWTNI